MEHNEMMANPIRHIRFIGYERMVVHAAVRAAFWRA